MNTMEKSFKIKGLGILDSKIALTGGSHLWDELTLEISENSAELQVRDVSDIDGTPMDEWHGSVQRIVIEKGPCVIDTAKMAKDLEIGGTLNFKAFRVARGLTVEWDGSNMVGRLSADASDALDEMIRESQCSGHYVEHGLLVGDCIDLFDFCNEIESDIRDLALAGKHTDSAAVTELAEHIIDWAAEEGHVISDPDCMAATVRERAELIAEDLED